MGGGSYSHAKCKLNISFYFYILWVLHNLFDYSNIRKPFNQKQYARNTKEMHRFLTSIHILKVTQNPVLWFLQISNENLKILIFQNSKTLHKQYYIN